MVGRAFVHRRFSCLVAVINIFVASVIYGIFRFFRYSEKKKQLQRHILSDIYTSISVVFLMLSLTELKFHHLPVEEFDSPSLQQIHDLHRIVQQAQEKLEVCC